MINTDVVIFTVPASCFVSEAPAQPPATRRSAEVGLLARAARLGRRGHPAGAPTDGTGPLYQGGRDNLIEELHVIIANI